MSVTLPKIKKAEIPQSIRTELTPKEWLTLLFRRTHRDWYAIIGLLLLSLAFFSPAILYGLSYGPNDLLSTWPLTHSLYAGFHNSISADQIQENSPWYYLNWQAIHHGQFPLWNQYVLLGLPQFANFQSAVLALPNIISYFFPANMTYLIIVIVTLFIGGTGAYFFSRCLGLTPLTAFFAASVYQLSGGFANEVGWTVGGVNAWTGWILAFSYLLLIKSEHRKLYLTLFAMSVAFAIYGGHPESCLHIAITTGIFLTVTIIVGFFQRRWNVQDIITFMRWEVGGGALGLLLAAPLILPGLDMITQSTKTAASYHGLPTDGLMGLVTQGFYGYPTAGSQMIEFNYYNTVSYVGPIVLILAIVALLVERHRAEIVALGVTLAFWFSIIYSFGPLLGPANTLPILRVIDFLYGLLPVDLCLAILAGIGLQHALQSAKERRLDFYVLAGTLLIILALFVEMMLISNDTRLTQSQQVSRYQSLLWPIFLLPLCLLLIALRKYPQRFWQWVLRVGLIGGQVTFLLLAGVAQNSYSSTFFPVNQDITTLQQITQGKLVGTINVHYANDYSTLGYIPEINSAYGFHQFTAYDPLLPKTYYSSWHEISDEPIYNAAIFSPSIETVAEAQLYGISYIIRPTVDNVKLSPSTDTVIASLATQYPTINGNNVQNTLEYLLHLYVQRLDLQFAFPATAPDCISDLLTWSLRYGVVADPVLGGDKNQLHILDSFFHDHGAVQQQLQTLFIPLKYSGMQLVKATDAYRLYAVPNSQQFTLASDADSSTAVSAPHWLSNNELQLQVNAPTATQLIVRLTNVPGWHAQVNGHDVPLSTWKTVMQQLAVPAGQSTVTLTYWPEKLTLGIALAGVSIGIILLLWLAPFLRSTLAQTVLSLRRQYENNKMRV